MGYSTLLFAVDLEKIRSTVQNQDMSVVHDAKEHDPDEFDYQLDDAAPTVGEALEQLIKGDLDAGHTHLYGYALKLMCDTVGVALPDDDVIGSLEPLRLSSPLEEFRCPIEIPAVNEDFPFVAYLSAAEVGQESERLGTLDLEFQEDEDIEEARHAYASCVRAAAASGSSIIAFYY